MEYCGLYILFYILFTFFKYRLVPFYTFNFTFYIYIYLVVTIYIYSVLLYILADLSHIFLYVYFVSYC
jgi:hypothetical protein